MSHVLFVCIQNAGRSQIAQALFEQAAAGRHEARSAGSRPAAHVHPEVVEVMAEAGIDLSGKVPHELDMDDMRWADLVVTMGCGDECPYVPGQALHRLGAARPGGAAAGGRARDPRRDLGARAGSGGRAEERLARPRTPGTAAGRR